MPHERSNIKERTNTSLKEPRKYKVMIYNDDFTTMDFVVKLLREVFFMPESRAVELMLQVHHGGSAVVGVYSHDIAMSKVRKATEMAREEGFPLRLEVEPE